MEGLGNPFFNTTNLQWEQLKLDSSELRKNAFKWTIYLSFLIWLFTITVSEKTQRRNWVVKHLQYMGTLFPVNVSQKARESFNLKIPSHSVSSQPSSFSLSWSLSEICASAKLQWKWMILHSVISSVHTEIVSVQLLDLKWCLWTLFTAACVEESLHFEAVNLTVCKGKILTLLN